MNIFAIDPGPTESAYVVLRGVILGDFGKVQNSSLIDIVRDLVSRGEDAWTELVIEQIAAMGMSVGAEVFETCVFSGRVMQEWDRQAERAAARVKRHEVKMHLCHSMRAKDPNIRQAIIDRYGGKDAAIGKKATPGPLYGVSGDVWAALAVAITYAETKGAGK